MMGMEKKPVIMLKMVCMEARLIMKRLVIRLLNGLILLSTLEKNSQNDSRATKLKFNFYYYFKLK